MALRIEAFRPPGSNEVEMAAVVAVLRHGLVAKIPEEHKSAVSARIALEQWYAVPKTGGLIAKALTGRVEGLLVFRSEPPLVRILWISVIDQRKGIGTQLMRALVDACLKRAVRDLVVEYPSEDTRATRFFEKLGFRPPSPGSREARLTIGTAAQP